MPSENLMKIIVAIEDKFSEQARKADDMLKKFGNTASQSNNKASQSADNVAKKYASTANSINRVAVAAEKVGQNGAKSFNNMGEATQKAVVNFNRLDKESQNMLRNLSQMSDKGRETFIGMNAKAQEAIAKFDALQNETRNWSNTLDYTRSKMQLMGTDVDSLKGKVQVVGSSIKTHLANSWDAAKTKVTVFGSYIKTHLSSALTSVRQKIESLGNAFNGLGGIIGSVFGAIGLNSVKEMTIGLSMNREQVKSLMTATYGAGAATDRLFNSMDKLTTQGVVSLDELTQAMSVIKMSTGATTEQLEQMMPVVNNIGQRAIMMGRSGEEAISLMQAAGKGLNGEFAMLQDNFGITKDKLKELGWSGAASDVEGYTKALQAYLDKGGSMEGLLNTTSGKLVTLQKNFRIAGRSIGDQFMPYINMALDALNKWTDPETGNGLAQWAIGLMAIGSGFATLAPTITPTLQALDIFWSKGRALLTFLGLLEAEEGALTVTTLANTIAEKANAMAKAAKGVTTAELTAEEVALGAARAGLTTEEIAAAAAHAGSAVAMTAEGGAAVVAAGGTTTLTGALWGMTTALLANPITWVVVALVALAVAVYEVGKAFGWWKDIPTLFAAVWAGINRIWNAFINHPDVQALINGIVWAWNWLCGAIGNTIKWIEDFFDIHINGEFDIVRAIIDAIGMAWQAVTFPIRLVISIIQFLIGAFQNTQKAVGDVINALKPFTDVLLFMLGPIGWVLLAFQKLQGFLNGNGGLSGALQTLQQVFTTVWTAISSFISGIVGPIISMFQSLYTTIVQLWNGQITLGEAVGQIWQTISSTIMQVLSHIISSIINFATTIGQWAMKAGQMFLENIISFFKQLPGMIWGILTNIAKSIGSLFGEKMGNEIGGAFEQAGSIIMNAFNTIVSYIQPLLDILTQIWEFAVSLFVPVWETIVQVFTTVYTQVMNLIGIFQQFLSGQISLPQLLGMAWNLISNTVMTALITIGNALMNFITSAWNYAVQIGTNLLNGIISYVSQIPGRVWNWLVQVGNTIISAGVQWVNYARSKASEIVSGVISYVSQLPGKVYQEFVNIGNRILQAGSQLVEKAKKIGQDIVKGLLNAMGIHSPGYIQEAVVNEFATMVDKIRDIKGKAGEYATQLGETIVDKFGEPKLSLDTEDLMPYQDLDENPFENVDFANLDLGGLSGGLASATGMTDDTNAMIGESYTALATMMSTTLENMVLNDQLAYGNIQTNDLNTFNTIKTSLQSTLLFMGTNLKTQLNLMTLTHKTAMDSANNTTRTQLASMLNQTTKVVSEMKSAWSIMADSIISAAARIKNESTSYFNQLASTIGNFYVKLQNPSRWGGSPDEAPRRPHGSPGASLMSRITRGMANAIRRDNQAPSNISVRSAKRYVNLSPQMLEYLGLNNSSNVSITDLIEGGLVNPLQLSMLASSGWADVANPNIKHIKKTAREWSMRGPQLMGRIDTGLAFKVKEFENGKPSISFDSFRRMAEALFSAIPYDFYYNSDKTGSWVTALQSGSVNCYDGAQALIALARTCGFDGYMAHGTWNGIPHVYAVINGMKMDTTGWQNRRSWAGVAAGGPRNTLRYRKTSIESGNVFDELKDLFKTDESIATNDVGSSVEEIKLKLEHNVNVNVEGNTEEIDTNVLIEELTASVTDRNLIDKIADALIKRDKRISRMGGA